MTAIEKSQSDISTLLAENTLRTYTSNDKSAALAEDSVQGLSAQTLFRALQVGPLHLANRIVMAPMTRFISPGGIPGPNVAAYYRRRIEGGAALVITEGAFIGHRAAGFTSSVPRFYGEDAAAGWKNVIDAVHGAGGRIMPQLWHVGLMPLPTDEPHSEIASSPSGFLRGNEKVGEPMSEHDIEEVIAAYGTSAALAYRLGCDGVQIHAAHGYLIDQFFWADTNHRLDGYGGAMASRGRFACEIVAECRRQTAPDFPISLRYSQWKQQNFKAKLAPTPQLLAAFLEPLVDAGVDMFDASTRRFWEPEFEESPLNLAGWTRKLTGKVSATVGSVSLSNDFFASLQANAQSATGNIARLVAMMERDDFDLVNIGRALIVDPEWPSKVRRGEWSLLQAYKPEALNTLF